MIAGFSPTERLQVVHILREMSHKIKKNNNCSYVVGFSQNIKICLTTTTILTQSIPTKWLSPCPGIWDFGYAMRDMRIAVADIQQIFFYRGMREEEQDLGYETEFGIWIWPQLEKSPKPAAPVSKPWSWVLSSFLYSSITSLVLENQRANVGFWTVGLLHIPKKCKRDTKGCKGGCKGGCKAGCEGGLSSPNFLRNRFPVAPSLHLPSHSTLEPFAYPFTYPFESPPSIPLHIFWECHYQFIDHPSGWIWNI